jgi:hypothetical protein
VTPHTESGDKRDTAMPSFVSSPWIRRCPRNSTTSCWASAAESSSGSDESGGRQLSGGTTCRELRESPLVCRRRGAYRKR